jgi:hypothetical protein
MRVIKQFLFILLLCLAYIYNGLSIWILLTVGHLGSKSWNFEALCLAFSTSNSSGVSKDSKVTSSSGQISKMPPVKNHHSCCIYKHVYLLTAGSRTVHKYFSQAASQPSTHPSSPCLTTLNVYFWIHCGSNFFYNY